MAYIGDVYVQYVDKVERSGKKDVKTLRLIGLDDPDLIEEKLDADDVRIGGVAVNDSTKTADQYIEDLKAAARRNAAYNHFDYAGEDGFIAVSSINAPKSADEVGVRKWNINGKFLPRTVYERAYKFTQEIEVNDFGVGFPVVIPLPIGATNVKLKSPWQTISLNSVWATVSGKDGDIPLYKPFPLFNAEEATTTGDLTYSEEAYRLQTVNLDAQAEYAEWSFNAGEDAPYGTYKLKIRVRDDNVANDITVTITGSKSGTILSETFSTGETDFVILETSEFLLDEFERVTIKIKKATADTNVIEVDYAYLDPTYSAKITFDVDSETDTGEVKVYDDMNETDEAKWIRVYNKEHKFTGNAVIENGVIRVVLSESEATLYGYSLSSSSWVEIGKIKLTRDFKEVLNDYVEFLDNNEISRLFLTLDYDWIYDGLVCYLPFVEGSGTTVYDKSGYGNNGTINSATWIKGRYGWALSFDGEDDYVEVLDSESLHFSQSNSFTVSFWLYLREHDRSQYFIEKYSSDEGFETHLYGGNNWIYSYVGDGTNTARVRTFEEIPLNAWTFIVVTYDGSKLRIYKDAALKDETDVAFTIDDSTQNLFIGCTDGADDFANAIIDEVRIYTRALTEEEIQALYTITKLWRIPTENLGYEINDGFVSATGFKKYGEPSFIGAIPLNEASKMFKEAEDAFLSAGAYINRYIDDFSADSSAEYTVLVGTGWSWDTTNGELDAYSDSEKGEVIGLNSLKFGTGTYSVDINIRSTAAIERQAGILFGLQKLESTQLTYYAYLFFDSSNNASIILSKKTDSGWSSLASTSVSVSPGTYYNLKVEWDTATGSIKVYFNNSTTPDISVTDTEYTSGYVGLKVFVSEAGTGNLDVSFDNLDIQAEEVTSSGNSCVIMGGTNHGGQSDYNEHNEYRFTGGTDIPKGRYLAIAKVKSTAPDTVEATMGARNNTDNTSLWEGSSQYEAITISSKEYNYYIRPIEINEDDEGDDLWVGIWEVNGNSNPVVIVDYFLLIPISLLESGKAGLQDLTFLSMVDPKLKRVLEVKDA